MDLYLDFGLLIGQKQVWKTVMSGERDNAKNNELQLLFSALNDLINRITDCVVLHC